MEMVDYIIINGMKAVILSLGLAAVCRILLFGEPKISGFLETAKKYFILKAIFIFNIVMICVAIGGHHEAHSPEERYKNSIDSLNRLEANDLDLLKRRRLSISEQDSLRVFIENSYKAKRESCR